MPKTIVKTMARDLADTLDDVVRGLKRTGEHVEDEAGERMSHAAKALSEAVDAFVTATRTKAVEAGETAAKEVKAHPVAIAAAAVAAATLMGLVVAHKVSKPDDKDAD